MLGAILFGIIGSVALGFFFLHRGWNAPGPNRYLGLYLLNAATVFALIALSHVPAIEAVDRVELFEHAFGLAAGPLLLGLVTQVHQSASRRVLLPWHLLPAAGAFAYAILALVFPLRDVLGSLPVVVHQFVYTVIATAVLFARRGTPAWCWLIVAAVWAVHLAQLLRLAMPETVYLQDVVPLTGTIALNVFVLVALYHSSLLDRLIPARRYSKSGLEKSERLRLAAQLTDFLERNPVHRDHDLTLASLAARLGWSEHVLSQVINSELDTGFAELIRKRRLADAKRLLLDPVNVRSSVESLGMEAGFRSRATFYRAFAEQEQMSPAEFRNRQGRS